MSDTKVIVVTCVKDEAWMLERFLATCSVFADHIIISDESTGLDESLQIYNKFPKVILHHNDGPSVRYDVRRRFVFDEARKIPCDKRIIIAIDSDEILSANILDSQEWQTVLHAKPGTLVHLQWVTLWWSTHYYRIDKPMFFGNYNREIWIDDGFSEIPEVGVQGMHMVYTPQKATHHIYLTDIVCLHYQFCNWERMESKHRYYRAHEKVNIKILSDLGIFRMYGYMLSKRIAYAPTLDEWFDGWKKLNVDVTSVDNGEIFYFDLELLKLIDKHGAKTFVRQDLWNFDWDVVISRAKDIGLLPQDYCLIKPRLTFIDKIFLKYVRNTIDNKFLRFIEMMLLGKKMSY